MPRQDVFPAPPRIRRPPTELRIAPVASPASRRAHRRSGRGRGPACARREPAVGEARRGLGERGGDLVGRSATAYTPERPAVIASRRPTSDRPGTAMTGTPTRARPPRRRRRRPAAQGLPVERALAGDDEVGGGHEVGEPDGVEHRLDARHRRAAEQVQRVAEPAGGAGAGLALGLEPRRSAGPWPAGARGPRRSRSGRARSRAAGRLLRARPSAGRRRRWRP